MTAKTLTILGTHSNAGKSILVTALCRIFAQEGYRVAPFKAQNMALNAGVTPQGHEIGRATIAQAEAAGMPPHVDMNPVLLKPEGHRRSQVVLNGRPYTHIDAGNWLSLKPILWTHITAALDRLRANTDLVIIEGAGSPAEINLKAGDIVNMRVAQYAQSPVLLVGDIDRGGVFAALTGTMMLLEPEERALVKAFCHQQIPRRYQPAGQRPANAARTGLQHPHPGGHPLPAEYRGGCGRFRGAGPSAGKSGGHAHRPRR